MKDNLNDIVRVTQSYKSKEEQVSYLKNALEPYYDGRSKLFWPVRMPYIEQALVMLKLAGEHEEILEHLFRPDISGAGPLHYALARMKPKKSKVDINKHTPIALELIKKIRGNNKVLKNALIQDSEGNTPIHYTAIWGYREVALAIFDAVNGEESIIDVLFAPNKEGRTPIDCAIEAERKDIALIILNEVKKYPKQVVRLLLKTPIPIVVEMREVAFGMIQLISNNLQTLRSSANFDDYILAIFYTALDRKQADIATEIAKFKELSGILKTNPLMAKCAFLRAASIGTTAVVVAIIETMKSDSKFLTDLFEPEQFQALPPLYRAVVHRQDATVCALVKLAREIGVLREIFTSNFGVEQILSDPYLKHHLGTLRSCWQNQAHSSLATNTNLAVNLSVPSSVQSQILSEPAKEARGWFF